MNNKVPAVKNKVCLCAGFSPVSARNTQGTHTLSPSLITSLKMSNRSLYVVYFNFLCLSAVTFEDKKRENFERGNLELEKRRQALQEQQRKEQERLAALEREELERKVNYQSCSHLSLQHCVHLN